MKKLLALLLVAVMLVAVVPVALADDAQIVVGSVQVDEGYTGFIEIPVSFVNNPGFTMMAITPDFDASITALLTSKPLKSSQYYDPDEDDNFDNFTFTFGVNYIIETAGSDNYTANGEAFKLRFKGPSLAEGFYTINFIFRDARNKANNAVAFTVVPGTLTVGNPSTSVNVETFKPDATDSSTWVAPTQTGKIFAGFYTDATYNTPYTEPTGSAEPKFVDAKVMDVYAQADATNNVVRFLSTVDVLDYRNVGFILQTDTWTVKRALTSVYQSVSAVGIDKTAAEVSGTSESHYISYVKLTGIPDTAVNVTVTVTPFWTTADGTEVTGTPVQFAVSYGASVTRL